MAIRQGVNILNKYLRTAFRLLLFMCRGAEVAFVLFCFSSCPLLSAPVAGGGGGGTNSGERVAEFLPSMCGFLGGHLDPGGWTS